MSAKGKEDSDSGKRPELAEKPKGCPFVGRRVKRSSLESLFEDMFAGDELPDLVVQEHDNGELLCIDAKKPGFAIHFAAERCGARECLNRSDNKAC